MGFFRSTKNFVGRGWNVRGWLQVDQLKKEHKLIKSMVSDLKSYNKPKKENQSYEQIVEEKKYTDQDISNMKKRAIRMTWAHIALAFLVTAYVTYLFAAGATLPGLFTIPIIFALLMLAFKENFFFFCLNKKSFNQTFSDWANQFVYNKGDLK